MNSLRLWPGVIAAVLLVLSRLVIPIAAPSASIVGVIGGVVCAVIVLLWWLLFSRVPWLERVGVLLVMIVALYATSFVVDESVRGGMMGMMLVVFATPIICLA